MIPSRHQRGGLTSAPGHCHPVSQTPQGLRVICSCPARRPGAGWLPPAAFLRTRCHALRNEAAPVPSCQQQGGSRPRAAARLTSVLGCEAVVGVLHEDDIVRLKHGLRGGVEVAVEPHVGVRAAVVADLDHPRGVTHALQRLGAAAPRLACEGERGVSGQGPRLVHRCRTASASSGRRGGETTE